MDPARSCRLRMSSYAPDTELLQECKSLWIESFRSSDRQPAVFKSFVISSLHRSTFRMRMRTLDVTDPRSLNTGCELRRPNLVLKEFQLATLFAFLTLVRDTLSRPIFGKLARDRLFCLFCLFCVMWLLLFFVDTGSSCPLDVDISMSSPLSLFPSFSMTSPISLALALCTRSWSVTMVASLCKMQSL